MYSSLCISLGLLEHTGGYQKRLKHASGARYIVGPLEKGQLVKVREANDALRNFVGSISGVVSLSRQQRRLLGLS